MFDCEPGIEIFREICAEVFATTTIPTGQWDSLCAILWDAYVHGTARPLQKHEHLIPRGSWDWPAWRNDLKHAPRSENPTPARMRDALSGAIIRRAYLRRRYMQMLANSDRRDIWEIRSVKDVRSPPECIRLHGLRLAFDLGSLRQYLPPHNTICRCAIRLYSRDELDEAGLPHESSVLPEWDKPPTQQWAIPDERLFVKRFIKPV